jgi:hypothetical protein
MIKSREIRWVGHITGMVKLKSVNRILVGKTTGKDYFGNLGMYERIILKWILQKEDLGILTGFT